MKSKTRMMNPMMIHSSESRNFHKTFTMSGLNLVDILRTTSARLMTNSSQKVVDTEIMNSLCCGLDCTESHKMQQKTTIRKTFTEIARLKDFLTI